MIYGMNVNMNKGLSITGKPEAYKQLGNTKLLHVYVLYKFARNVAEMACNGLQAFQFKCVCKEVL